MLLVHIFVSKQILFSVVGKFVMSFQDVTFLPSRASFFTTCRKTVVGGKKGHAPCKALLFHEASFCIRQISWIS